MVGTVVNTALAAFIEMARRTSVPDIGRHLRYPLSPRGTLQGSELGASLWASAEGRVVEANLLRWLLACSGTPEPSPQFALAEVHGRVATLVEMALRSPDSSTFAVAAAPALFNDLTSAPSGMSLQLVAGPVAPPSGFRFFDYLEVTPATRQSIPSELLLPVDQDWTSLPREGLILVRSTFRLRSRQTVMPAMEAALQSLHLQSDLNYAIWLLTGHFPRWLVRWMGETAAFPSSPPIHERRSVLDGPASGLCPTRALDPASLFPVFHLVRNREWMGMDDDSFDVETAVALRAAYFLTDSSSHEADEAQLAVHTYSALEGLLTFDGDSDLKELSRAAALLGSTRAERRTLSRRLDALRVYRHAVMHRSRPTWDEAEALGGVTGLAPDDLVDRHVLQQEIRRVTKEILRCTFGAMLWLTAEVQSPAGEPPRTRPRMSKAEVLKLLDDASGRMSPDRERATSALSRLVPEWLRDPLGGAPRG